MEWLRWWHLVPFAVELGLRLAVIARIVMRGPRHSATALAWIAVLAALPIVGLVAWVLVGEVRLGRRRRARYREHYALVTERLGVRGPVEEHRSVPAGYEGTIALAEAVGGTPPRGGNEVHLHADASQTIAALVADVDAAREHCHLLYYIFLDDGAGRQVASALARAAARGVQCRLLVDHVGSRPFLASRLCADLRAAGVQVLGAMPASLLRAGMSRMDVRNHRKLAVVDGRIGYTGSQNVAEASFAPKPRFAPWVDCTLRIRGPVVRDLQTLFACDWFLESHEMIPADGRTDGAGEVAGDVTLQILPSGPLNDNEALEQLMLSAFHTAREELILTTPYFVPAEAEVNSLSTAARRGVHVMLVLPERNDSWLVGAVSRSHYLDLIEAGVEIFEYQKGLLHAKTMTVDRDLAFVSTANFDRRSFELNFEVSALVYDSDFASQLRFLQRSYVQDSRPVAYGSTVRRAWPKRLLDNAAGVFSPLL